VRLLARLLAPRVERLQRQSSQPLNSRRSQAILFLPEAPCPLPNRSHASSGRSTELCRTLRWRHLAAASLRRFRSSLGCSCAALPPHETQAAAACAAAGAARKEPVPSRRPRLGPQRSCSGRGHSRGARTQRVAPAGGRPALRRCRGHGPVCRVYRRRESRTVWALHLTAGPAPTPRLCASGAARGSPRGPRRPAHGDSGARGRARGGAGGCAGVRAAGPGGEPRAAHRPRGPHEHARAAQPGPGGAAELHERRGRRDGGGRSPLLRLQAPRVRRLS